MSCVRRSGKERAAGVVVAAFARATKFARFGVCICDYKIRDGQPGYRTKCGQMDDSVQLACRLHADNLPEPIELSGGLGHY